MARRVELTQGRVYRVGLDLRADAEVEIALRLCERHLLFEGACQRGQLRIGSTPGVWQHHSSTLVGPSLTAGAWWAPRLGLLTLSVPQAGASVDLAKISLGAAMPAAAVTIGDFSQSLARWFPVAEVHFLPWHIDNLYLELLIERGLLGLLLTVSALLMGLWCATCMSGPGSLLRATLAAGMTGGLLVGALGSIMDVPRVAFLLFLLMFCAMALWRGGNTH
ncbi:hypothetical protein [Rhodoferax sp.]|uniref:hypothetical protein n=1 Tax=Rhodoferax sp. TaxID=50421 RepID=UPI00274B0059|nr:hypothetical protein [Rhodoferax sp.]